MKHLFFGVLAKLWRYIGNADSAGEDVGNALSVAELVNGLCVVRFGVVKLHVFTSLSSIASALRIQSRTDVLLPNLSLYYLYQKTHPLHVFPLITVHVFCHTL